ncbi:Sec-independent protein secretion pathway component protein [Microbacterium sp. C448]|uniref:twin-arginine translocase TatA/TatE family subunit n=1 Tax=Microbacterium TaxID=33882 RepID=UPI0003DE4E16|nr:MULTISPECIES: twin-arginine translocase TatA/TatE family subunit [Microbacterium]CDJ99456.1 Sec-independent protein secretion pathway component protein [Microbacterium sp. C448]
MFFGLTIEKLLLIGVIAALLVGPERLPRYAEGLAKLLGRLREFLRGAKTRVRDEMGEDFDDVDWRRLDPRQYDPRRIIREALLDEAPIKPVSPGAPRPATAALGGAGAAGAGVAALAGASDTAAAPASVASAPNATPYDSEAT